MMSEVFTCSACSSPWIDKMLYPAVFETLDHLPIGWCLCHPPTLELVSFAQYDYREVYMMALSDTVSDQDNHRAVLLDEDILVKLQWVRRKEQDWWLTNKGRRLLPLCLVVASDIRR